MRFVKEDHDVRDVVPTEELIAELGSQTEQTRIASEERMAGLRAFGHFDWHQISPFHFKMLCASK